VLASSVCAKNTLAGSFQWFLCLGMTMYQIKQIFQWNIDIRWSQTKWSNVNKNQKVITGYKWTDYLSHTTSWSMWNEIENMTEHLINQRLNVWIKTKYHVLRIDGKFTGPPLRWKSQIWHCPTSIAKFVDSMTILWFRAVDSMTILWFRAKICD